MRSPSKMGTRLKPSSSTRRHVAASSAAFASNAKTRSRGTITSRTLVVLRLMAPRTRSASSSVNGSARPPSFAISRSTSTSASTCGARAGLDRERPRRRGSRGVAAARLHGVAAARLHGVARSSPRNVAAEASPQLVSTECPRRSRGVATTRLHGLYSSSRPIQVAAAASPRFIGDVSARPKVLPGGSSAWIPRGGACLRARTWDTRSERGARGSNERSAQRPPRSGASWGP